ncbi:MAG: ribosome-associated translation inhibitor RaiA [Ignavibacteriae bacterium]|nr:MAG: ribosome-associated translation inhibitor RaiA [Ignavibacteriota bacterium]
MKFVFTSRHFKAHDSLKEFAEKEVDKLNKFFDGIMKCEVILSYEKPTNSIKIAEIIIDTNTHTVLTAKATSGDFLASMEMAFDKAVVQLKKLKDKLKSSHSPRLSDMMNF